MLLNDCLIHYDFSMRHGVEHALYKAKKNNWRVILYGEDDSSSVQMIAKKLPFKFDLVLSGEEMDDQGLRNLSVVKGENKVFVSSSPRDLEAARSHKTSFIKVPPFSEKTDSFDFSVVHELLEVGPKHFSRLKKLSKYEGPEIGFTQYSGSGIVIKIYSDRFEAQFS